MVRLVSGFFIAVIATYVLGAVFVSQGNLVNVAELGLTVTFADRLDAMIHDVTHMYDIYLPLVTLSLLIAFLVAAVIIRFVPNLRLTGYVLAGFTGLIACHVLIKLTFGVSGIAATREITGLFAQGLAGAVGGYVFAALTRKPPPSAL